MLRFLYEIFFFTRGSWRNARAAKVGVIKYLINYPRCLMVYLVLTYFGKHTTIVRAQRAPTPHGKRKYYKR